MGKKAKKRVGRKGKTAKIVLPHKLSLDAQKRSEVLKHIHLLEQEDQEIWAKKKLDQTNKSFTDYALKLKKLLKRSRKL